MSLKRILKWTGIVVAVLLVGVLLYLTFSELAWVEGTIESAVTEATGREFEIEGEFVLHALWTPSVLVEGVGLPNAEWGSEPMMVEVGHFSGRVDLWSLVSGPILVEEVRLHDVTVLLEKNEDGVGNWEMAKDEEDQVEEPEEEEPSGEAEIPLIVQFAEVRDISVTYREPGASDRVLTMDSLDLAANEELHLELQGGGKLNQYDWRLGGTVGPFGAVKAGKDILVDVQGALGELELEVEGNVATVEVLEGTNLNVLVALEDVVPLVENLELPLNVSGPLRVEADLAAMGADSTLEASAKIGEIGAEISAELGPGEIDFETKITDLSQIGAAVNVEGLPEFPVTVAGGVTAHEDTWELRDVRLLVGQGEGRFSGHVRKRPDATTDLEIDVSGADLRNISSALPEMPFTVRAKLRQTPDQLLLEPADVTLGDSRITAFLEVDQGTPVRVVGRLQSDSLDLTPFVPEMPSESDQAPPPPSEAEEVVDEDAPTSEWVFQDEPLSLEALEQYNAQIDLDIDELIFGGHDFLELRGSVRVGDGELAVNSWHRTSVGGHTASKISVSSDGQRADVSALLMGRDWRINVLSGELDDPSQRPPIDVTIDLETSGSSPRSLAESANGSVLISMGSGQVASSLLGAVSGDIVAQLISALNPFSKSEPYTQQDCVVVAVDIEDGVCDLSTVYVQGEKLTIIADGEVDLNTEKLKLEFNTKPRTGVGVSADMFVTPFVQLTGTLAHPRVGLSKQGALVSGGLAVATGGLSILAQGAKDRATGGVDRCEEKLEGTGGHPELSDLGVPVVQGEGTGG